MGEKLPLCKIGIISINFSSCKSHHFNFNNFAILILDVGTQGEGADRSIGKSLETIVARPGFVGDLKELAKKRNNEYTQNEQYRFIGELPEDVKEAASQTADGKNGEFDVAGWHEKGERGISNITPKGSTGTIAHETLHGLENHPELMAELAEWKESVKQWAKENGKDIPADTELVSQAFTHRLGYPEPMAEKVNEIPIPDELLKKVAEAAGTGERGLQLRGDKMPEPKAEPMPEPEPQQPQPEPVDVYDSDGSYQGFRTEDGDTLPFSLAPARKAPSMEEARASVPEKERNKLERGWDIATSGKGDPNRRFYFDRPSEKLKTKINQVLNKNLDIDNQVITLGHIKHINNRHGVGNEAIAEQTPIIKEIFTLIPDALANFDTVEKSSYTSRGDDVVKITKQYADGTMIITDAILQKNDPKNPKKANLEIRTVYVKVPKNSKERASASNYNSLAGQAGVTRTNPATLNIQKNLEKSTEKEVRFSLASTAGVPENLLDNSKAVEKAKKVWNEMGVESPLFKKWFAGSEVVDKNGKPLAVYHGTDLTFTEFKPNGTAGLPKAMYFSDSKKIANTYHRQGNLMKVYLSIKDPYVADANGQSFNDYYSQLSYHFNNIGEHDGLVIKNLRDDNTQRGSGGIKATTYIVFEPTQIKSATDNIGTFDEGNPDIRFSLRGKDKETAGHAKEKQIHHALTNFLRNDVKVWGGNLENMLSKANAKWHGQKKKGSTGMAVEHSPELDKLVERIAQDPDLAALIGYHNDEAGAGDKIIDIALKYDRLSDNEKLELGRRAREGYGYDEEYLNSPEATNDRFNYELEQQIEGNLPKGHVYQIGKPGNILLNAGIPDLPIELSADMLAYKASEDYRHPFNLSEVKDLPNAIQDPIAIFAYGDKEKAVNIITEIEQNGKNFLVGISLNPEVNRKKLGINSIRTVFPKDVHEWKNWIDQGKALYLNEEKIEAMANPRHPEDVTKASPDKYTKEKPEALEKSSEVAEIPAKSTQKYTFSEETAEKAAAKEPQTEPGQQELDLGTEIMQAIGEPPSWYLSIPDSEARWKRIYRQLVDERVDFKEIEKVLKVENKDSFYRAAKLSPGIVSEKTRQLSKRLKDIAYFTKKNKLDGGFVDNYIESLHTKERNAEILKREGKKDGSGHPDEWADQIQERYGKLGATDKEAIQKILKICRGITNSVINDYVSSGLWSTEYAAKIRRTYPNYVPLRGLPETLAKTLVRGSEGNGADRGLTARPDKKTAKGRLSAAENIIPQIIALKEQSVKRANNNENLQRLAKIIALNPNPHLWEIDSKSDRLGNEFKYYADGVEHEIKTYGAEGKRLAEHILGLDRMGSHKIIDFIGYLTRLRAQFITSWSPTFIINNFRRDFTHAVSMGYIRYGGNTALKIALKEMPTIVKLFANGAVANDADKLRQRWRNQGGSMGLIQSINHGRETKRLAQELYELTSSNKLTEAKVLWDKFIELMSEANSLIEDSTRLVVFQVLTEKGMSDADAAIASRDITVDFNQFGASGRDINKLFMFFNARVQGTNQILSAFSDPDPAVRKRAKVAFGFAFGSGIIGGILNHWGKIAAAAGIYWLATKGEDGEQDNEREKYSNIAEHEKNKNAIIPMPWSKDYYGKWPLPQEFAPIFNGGARLAELILNDKFTASEFAAGTINDVFNAMSPIDFYADKDIIKTIIPSIGHPIYEMSVNRKFTGQQIYPEYRNEKLAMSRQYSENVMPWFRDAAVALNHATGGTNYNSGSFLGIDTDFNPHTFQHYAVSYFGGLGSLAEKSWGIVYAKARGEEVDVTRYPFVDLFVKKISDAKDRSEAMEIIDHAEGVFNEYKDLLTGNAEFGIKKDLEAAEEMKNKNYGEIMFFQFADAV